MVNWGNCEIIFFINQKKILSRFRNLTYVWFSCFIFAVVRFLIIFFSDGLLILLIFAQLLHAITFGLHHVTSIMLVTNLFPDSAKAIGQSSYTVASYGIGGSLGGVFWFNMGRVFSRINLYICIFGCFFRSSGCLAIDKEIQSGV